MIHISFGGCLGALHLPEGNRAGHAVVLCPAFGYEAICAHRAFVALGEELAAAGVAALRFDYPGQGDSIDLPPEADAVAAWLSAITAAARFLRTHFPEIAVSLAGHRLGGLLAAKAAEQILDIAGLVLIAPVVSGNSYIRELTLTSNPAETRDGLDASGWHLSEATLTHLSSLSLQKIHPAARALILSEGRNQNLQKLAARLGAAWHESPDLAALNQHAHAVEVPETSFSRIVNFLARHQPPMPAQPPRPIGPAELDLPGGSERAVRFGPEGRLFGVMNLPRAQAAGAPALLILNTGANPRSGHARLSVRIARFAATLGMVSLRIDVTGNGDSLPVLRGRNFTMYNAELGADVAAAADHLQASGFARVVVCGLCSGAYHGLHAAVADARIVGSAMVNSQSFLWPKGKHLDVAIDVSLRAVDSYLPRARDWRFWLRVLRGRTRVRGILNGIADHYLFSAGAALQAKLPRLTILPRARAVQRNFAALAARAIPVLIVYSRGDPGINELHACFGRGGRRLRDHKSVRIRYIENADHTLTAERAKRDLIAMLGEFLETQFLGRDRQVEVKEKEGLLF